MGTIGSVEDDGVMEMDDADWHLETIQEKNLPVDELNAYNHLTIYPVSYTHLDVYKRQPFTCVGAWSMT